MERYGEQGAQIKINQIRTVPQDYLGSPIQKEGSHLSCSWLNTWNPTYMEKIKLVAQNLLYY